MTAKVPSNAASPSVGLTPPVVSDCSVDVSAELNAWLAKVPDDSVVALAPGGCYRTDREVVVDGHHGFDLEGNGATFKRFTPTPPALRYPHKNPHLTFIGDTDVTVHNLKIEGLNTAACPQKWTYDPQGFGCKSLDGSFEYGLGLFDDTNVSVSDVAIDAVWGDGITIGSDGPNTCDRDVTVDDATIDRDGRHGIAIVCAVGVTVTDTKILHSQSEGFDLEPNGAPAHVENVTISGCYINAQHLAFSAMGAHDVSDVTITHNHIQGSVPSWPWLNVGNGPHRDFTVTDNTVIQPRQQDSITFANTTNITVTGNTSPTNRRYAGVSLDHDNGTITIQTNNFGPGVQPTTTGTGAVEST